MDQNDYELIYLARQQNEEANILLYNKYLPLINKKSVKAYSLLKNKGIEYSDIKQECLIAFEQAIYDYDEEDKTMFYTFVNLCLDRHLKHFAYRINNNKFKTLNEALSLEVYNEEGEELNILDSIVEKSSNPEYNLVLEEDKDELEKTIKDKLTPREELIFDLKMQGFTNKEIEEITGKDTKTIYNTLQRIKAKIVKILEDR